jgi:hypothetical protein
VKDAGGVSIAGEAELFDKSELYKSDTAVT